MLNQVQEPEIGLRYDTQMQRRVVEIAARLQQEDEDRQTVHQIVDAAAEIGLHPHYVQQAIAQVKAEQTAPTVHTTNRRSTSLGHREYGRFMTTMVTPMALGTLAFALKNFTGMAILLSMILPIPLACLSGFLTGRKRVGFVTAALLVLALAPTAYHLGIHAYYSENSGNIYTSYFQQFAHSNGQGFALTYLTLGVPLAGLLGMFGAWTRKSHFPDSSFEDV